MDVLASTSATTLVPACAERTWVLVQELVDGLWPGATTVLHAEPGRLLVHAVDEAGEPDCWLTWRLEPACGGTTRVQLALDELASTAPPPELDAVLVELLTAACRGRAVG
jgi:hypothetical protein